MKLQTSIAPRRDGVVKVTGQDRQTYVFAANSDGDLVCDVTDEATVAMLLTGGLFFPADPADFDAALQLTQQLTDDTEAEVGEDDAEDDHNPNALPIEAQTPPAAAPGRKTRKAA